MAVTRPLLVSSARPLLVSSARLSEGLSLERDGLA